MGPKPLPSWRVASWWHETWVHLYFRVSRVWYKWPHLLNTDNLLSSRLPAPCLLPWGLLWLLPALELWQSCQTCWTPTVQSRAIHVHRALVAPSLSPGHAACWRSVEANLWYRPVKRHDFFSFVSKEALKRLTAEATSVLCSVVQYTCVTNYLQVYIVAMSKFI